MSKGLAFLNRIFAKSRTCPKLGFRLRNFSRKNGILRFLACIILIGSVLRSDSDVSRWGASNEGRHSPLLWSWHKNGISRFLACIILVCVFWDRIHTFLVKTRRKRCDTTPLGGLSTELDFRKIFFATFWFFVTRSVVNSCSRSVETLAVFSRRLRSRIW